MTPTCHPHDSGALAFVNLLGNDIPPEQAQELIKVMESKENLRTLCGFTGEEKELDLSNKGLTAGCAVLVSNEIQDMGALACDDGMVYKTPLLGSKCKNCGKGKDQHKKRCVLPPL